MVGPKCVVRRDFAETLFFIPLFRSPTARRMIHCLARPHMQLLSING